MLMASLHGSNRVGQRTRRRLLRRGTCPPIRTIAQHAEAASEIPWCAVIADEVSKHCAAHFDEDQASWGNGWKDQSLYHAWHETAQIDRNAELLGLAGMRNLVASLSKDPKAAAVDLLCRMKVPYPLWSTVLLSNSTRYPAGPLGPSTRTSK